MGPFGGILSSIGSGAGNALSGIGGGIGALGGAAGNVLGQAGGMAGGLLTPPLVQKGLGSAAGLLGNMFGGSRPLSTGAGAANAANATQQAGQAATQSQSGLGTVAAPSFMDTGGNPMQTVAYQPMGNSLPNVNHATVPASAPAQTFNQAWAENNPVYDPQSPPSNSNVPLQDYNQVSSRRPGDILGRIAPYFGGGGGIMGGWGGEDGEINRENFAKANMMQGLLGGVGSILAPDNIMSKIWGGVTNPMYQNVAQQQKDSDLMSLFDQTILGRLLKGFRGGSGGPDKADQLPTDQDGNPIPTDDGVISPPPTELNKVSFLPAQPYIPEGTTGPIVPYDRQPRTPYERRHTMWV